MIRRPKEIEGYFWLSLILMVIANRLAFLLGRLLAQGRVHYDVTLPIDFAVPFMPWTISIYFGCFIFWFLIYRLAAQLPRENADRFFCANLLGKVISFLFFVCLPTTLIRPELYGTTFWDASMRFLYEIDAPDCLFPSLHCMVSWLCWVGIRGNKQVPLPWRVAALLMAILVCFSTLTTRQHVLPDVAGGILFAELCYWLAGRSAIRSLYTRLIDRLSRLVFSLKKG